MEITNARQARAYVRANDHTDPRVRAETPWWGIVAERRYLSFAIAGQRAIVANLTLRGHEQAARQHAGALRVLESRSRKLERMIEQSERAAAGGAS